MARNGSGSYSAPSNSWNPAVSATTIDSSNFNTLLDDLETALTESIARDGQTATTAVVPFASGIKSDTIVENSGNTGVTIDGVLVKDGGLTLGATGVIIFEGTTADAFETTLTSGDPTADRVVTMPDATDTIVGKATTDTLTNKTIDAASNTLSLTADSVDAITEIAAALKSGADGTIVTGTAGVNGNLAEWNTDGDVVDSGVATSSVPSITAGTALTKDPVAFSSSTVQAHGLGAEPSFLKVVLECKTGEGGYSSGDRILISAGGLVENTGLGSAAYSIVVDATNVTLLLADAFGRITNKTTQSNFEINAANWKVIVTPYLFG